jgi:hypothetical protein
VRLVYHLYQGPDGGDPDRTLRCPGHHRLRTPGTLVAGCGCARLDRFRGVHGLRVLSTRPGEGAGGGFVTFRQARPDRVSRRHATASRQLHQAS